MVQLESVAQGGPRIVIRFDTSHGYVHQHLFDAAGGHRRLKLEFKDWAQAYTYCYEYVKRNWESEVLNFERGRR